MHRPRFDKYGHPHNTRSFKLGIQEEALDRTNFKLAMMEKEVVTIEINVEKRKGAICGKVTQFNQFPDGVVMRIKPHEGDFKNYNRIVFWISLEGGPHGVLEFEED